MRQGLYFLAAMLATAALASAGIAQSVDAPGVTDTEIKLGQTIPLSGPLSVYATFSRASLAYFAMVNDEGGINGRKVNLVSVDDAFSPPKTVEQTRRLVEGDEVFAIFAPMGSLTGVAVQKYLNMRGVPQLLVQSGLARWNNPHEFPWSIAGLPNYDVEVAMYAKYITTTMPAARIAVLYQNDEFGRSYLGALKTNLADRADDMIVAAESFSLTDPTVDSQVVKLDASKADTLLIAATAKQTVQTLKKLGELNWHPRIFVALPAASVERTYQPAGVENAKGAISATVFKDPSDPETADDPDMRAFLAFMAKYYPSGDKNDVLNVAAFVEGELTTELLRRCGRDLSRENLLNQARSFQADALPMIRKGVEIRIDPDNYTLFRSLQLVQFDGTRNRAIGLAGEH